MKKSEAMKAIHELARQAEGLTAEVNRLEAFGGASERKLDEALPKRREMLAMRVGIVNALAAAYAILSSDVESHERIDYEGLMANMYDTCIEALIVMRTGYKRRNDD